MPVNSFENYPMNWKPDKELLKFPVYISLAELLEQDIMSGRLPANTQLPPQRELADFLDVNLSTISRFPLGSKSFFSKGRTASP